MPKTLYTISYNEDIKGWTSFHSFQPDWMIGINNDFYTFKNGELYLHNSNDVPRNEFYGVSYPSKISLVFNQSPSDVKELQAVSLEGSHPWDIDIKAFIDSKNNFTESSINDLEFVNKEGMWYAYARRNEDVAQVDSKSAYGVGVITSIVGNNITINGFSDFITQGDRIVSAANLSLSGAIVSSTRIGNITTIVLTSVAGLVVGDFVLGMKDARIEGGNLRGYVLRFDLEIDNPEKVELFAVNSDVVKSFS